MDGADEIYQGPDNTALRFFTQPSKNNFQSEKNGRPIFDTSLMVEVMVPGSRESTPVFEVERTFCEEAGHDANGQRIVDRSVKYAQYREQVEAYKSRSGNGLATGTPLSEWPQIDVGTTATLKAAGIHTVEMLAGVQDTHLPNLGIGGRVLRDQAIAFINTRQFGVPSAKMAADSAHLHDELARVTAERDDFASRLTNAMAEITQLRTGSPAPALPAGKDASNGAGASADPMGTGTISQPNPFATLNPASASPLTPTGDEANKGAKAASEATTKTAQNLGGAHQVI